MENSKMFIFSLMLITIFSITSVYSRHGGGHGGHGGGHGGHSSGSSHGSSSSHGGSVSHGGESSHGGSVSHGGESSHGSGSIHGSDSGHGYGSDSESGSSWHPVGGHESSHIGSHGQSHHDSQFEPEGLDHHNSGGYGDSVGDSPHSHHVYPNNHHHHGNNQAHNARDDEWTTTTTPTPTTTPAPKIDETWWDLSCNNELPDFMGKKYPRKRVTAAVKKLKEVLDSGNSDLRRRIKSEVKDYFFNQNIQSWMPDYGAAFSSSDGCEEIESHIAPLGGCDTSSTAVIVVNVPDLPQVLKTKTCRSFSFCNYAEGSMCFQSAKQQTLLVLPAKRGSFNLADFSVATFRIRDGCQCLSGDQININNLNNIIL